MIEQNKPTNSALRSTQGIEARRAKTEGLGATHESPVAWSSVFRIFFGRVTPKIGPGEGTLDGTMRQGQQ